MTSGRPSAIYLARADSATETANAANIALRLALPVFSIPVLTGTSFEDLLEQIQAYTRTGHGSRPAALVVNAFLGQPAILSRTGSPWVPHNSDLPDLLDLHAGRNPGPRCLLSLQLVWTLWTEGRLDLPVFVTTAEVGVGPEARLALAEAFGDGLACVLEDWRGRWRGHGLHTLRRASA